MYFSHLQQKIHGHSQLVRVWSILFTSLIGFQLLKFIQRLLQILPMMQDNLQGFDFGRTTLMDPALYGAQSPILPEPGLPGAGWLTSCILMFLFVLQIILERNLVLPLLYFYSVLRTTKSTE